ncbi:MFS transporter [Streptomyces sp. NBC_00878]|uniref:MFS transporter n=1 Tax=Streptomyces sp. NBC_00878 TaxID=2975854 RepID=UPI00225AA5E9|nr:MFS transporter [Streptomyces sp. NBC_00878]MCX4903605.1 MFS transporter [Streptomyces sp. NBC_00878]
MSADVGTRKTWSRDFGLFFTARAVAKLGDTMLPVAPAAGLLQHGYGVGAVGLAMAASAACFAGLVIFGGVFADRFSTRLLMIGADVVRLGTQSVAAALFFTGHVVLWQICVIGAVHGAATAIFEPGVAGTVPRLATDVQAANGAIRVAESTAQLAGPALAGLLVAFASPGGVFAAHVATYALSALCLLLLRLPPAGADGRARGNGFGADLVQGWREFRSRTWLWASFACFPAAVGAGFGVAVMAAGAVTAGAGLSFWGVMWATSVQTQVPPDALNRIHAYDIAGSLAMMPVGQALAGQAAEALGADHVLLVAGAMTLVVAMALLSVPAIRGLVRAEAPASLSHGAAGIRRPTGAGGGKFQGAGRQNSQQNSQQNGQGTSQRSSPRDRQTCTGTGTGTGGKN